jgi:hypothetical protein
MLNTLPYQEADLDGDGFICGVSIIPTPEALTHSLIAQVEAMLSSGILNEGQANSMTQKLEGALAAIDTDKPSADNKLDAFINEVEGYVNGGNLLPGAGQELIDAALQIIALL